MHNIGVDDVSSAWQTYVEIIENIQSHTVVSSGVFGVCEWL